MKLNKGDVLTFTNNGLLNYTHSNTGYLIIIDIDIHNHYYYIFYDFGNSRITKNDFSLTVLELSKMKFLENIKGNYEEELLKRYNINIQDEEQDEEVDIKNLGMTYI